VEKALNGWVTRPSGREKWHSLQAVGLVFDDPFAVSMQDRTVQGEQRWQTIGLVGSPEGDAAREEGL
jgi:hypothetical protein